MPAHERHQLTPERFGTIVFARILSLSLARYGSFIAKIETSAAFRSLRSCIRESVIEGAWVDPVDGSPAAEPELGKLSMVGETIRFCYGSASFAREYRFCDATLRASNLSGPQDRLLHQLRLINSRNRLTHALVDALLKAQGPYLRTRNPLSMAALPQAAMSRLLQAQGMLSMKPDAGRISRLVRGLALRTLDGDVLPFSALFPSERKIHRYRLEALIRTEKLLILNGQLVRPWSDDMLAALLSENHPRPMTGRSVGHIRHQLGIPCCRQRSHCLDYLTAAEGFSPLFPLTPSNLLALVPNRSGVYEIRTRHGMEALAIHGKASPTGVSNVVYIGSSGDLRKRILDHLRGHSDNPGLFNLLNAGSALARFRTVASEWRLIERQLYLAFCASFGHPPVCNRISP